jgi:NDP-sugar pyrophosphorylase family protein
MLLLLLLLLNSDVVCEYPLKEMLDYHRARGAESTILVTKVRKAVCAYQQQQQQQQLHCTFES